MHRDDRPNDPAGEVNQIPLPVATAFILQKSGDGRGRNVEGHRIDIDKDRRGADARDATASGKESVGGRDHGIAGPDPEGHEDGEERVRARGNPDGVLRTAILRERALELLHLRPEDKTLGRDDLIELAPDRFRQHPVLFAQVEQRHAHLLPKHEWRPLANVPQGVIDRRERVS